MEYTRVSADCHIDLCWLPPTLFTDEATPAMKSRMPYVASGPKGEYWTTPSGANLGLKNGVGPTGAPYVPGQHARVDRMAETGLYRDGERDEGHRTAESVEPQVTAIFLAAGLSMHRDA